MNGKTQITQFLPTEEMNQDTDENIWATTSIFNPDPVIGIDLGTSNSCVGIWDVDKSRVKVIKNLKHERITPTTIKFHSFKTNEVEIGLSSDDPMVLSGFKRFIGLTGEQITGSYINGSLPEGVTTNHQDEILLKCRAPLKNGVANAGFTTECRSPEDLSVLVLDYLKTVAEKYLIYKKILRDENDFESIARSGIELPTKLSRVVIGVPHTFTTNQRNATINAAKRAGFTEVHLMVESTAAALGYGLLCAGTKSILVVDIGGGTTDVTITSIKDNTLQNQISNQTGGVEVSVMATAGHSQCGGRDVDHLLAWYICNHILHTQFTSQSGNQTSHLSPERDHEHDHDDDNLHPNITPEIQRDAAAGLSLLIEKCRLAKECLSSEDSTPFSFPSYSHEIFTHMNTLLASSLLTFHMSSSSSTWKYSNYSQSRTSSQVTSNHTSITDIYSRYSDILAEIDATPGDLSSSFNGDDTLGMDVEEVDEDGELESGDSTWRVVPDSKEIDTSPQSNSVAAPEPFPREIGRKISDPPPSSQTNERSQSALPQITKTETSFELTLTRDLLTTLITPLLVQIKGVVSTAIDIYYLKKSREMLLSNSPEDATTDSSSSSPIIDIDEVILVGGSSLIPSIQQTIRDILKEKCIPSFSGPSEKEFCSSICPYECVVNGLAVKGGLLSGVSSVILQDILMIDVTPSTIGIMVWMKQNSSSALTTSTAADHSEESEEYVSIFEPVIPRGTSLPCQIRQTYEIDEQCLNSGLLILQLYEEIYPTNNEMRSFSPRNDNNDSQAALPVAGGRLIEKLGSYELPIRDCIYQKSTKPVIVEEEDEITGDDELDQNEENSIWYVDIELSINAEGILSYAVCPPPSPSSSVLKSGEGNEEGKEEGRKKSELHSISTLQPLYGYLIFLILIYLFVKIQFNLPSSSSEDSLPIEPDNKEEEQEQEWGRSL